MSHDANLYIGWYVTFTPVQKAPKAFWLLPETDKDELEYMLEDRPEAKVTLDDIKLLQSGYAPFPDYLGTKKTVIMAPGYMRVLDIARSDGFVKPITAARLPHRAWLDAVNKVFGATDTQLEYGIVMEVV